MFALLGMSLYTCISGLLQEELFPGECARLRVGVPYGVANAMFGGTAAYAALSLKLHGIETACFW